MTESISRDALPDALPTAENGRLADIKKKTPPSAGNMPFKGGIEWSFTGLVSSPDRPPGT